MAAPHAILHASAVVAAFGACLARRAHLCASATILPYPPDKIRAAIKLLLPLMPEDKRLALRVAYSELEAFLPEQEWDVVRAVALAYREAGFEACAALDDPDGRIARVLSRMTHARGVRVRELEAFEAGLAIR